MITYASDERLDVLLDAGHAAYGPPLLRRSASHTPPLRVAYLSVQDGMDFKVIPKNMKLAKKLAESPNNWLDPKLESDLEWTTLGRFSGPLYAHAEAFRFMAAQLMPCLDGSGYTPGGDDDFFDYYPSGLRMLREWAYDLDAYAKDYNTFYQNPGFHSVYTHVMLDFLRHQRDRFVKQDGDMNWYAQEGAEEAIEQLMADLNLDADEVIKLVPSFD